MICDRLRDSHQLSIKFHRLQKTASIAFEHFFDPFRGTVLIHLRQILNQIIFHQFFEHPPVRDHQDIRQSLILYQNIDKLIITIFTLHIYILILNVQDLFEIAGIGIIFIGISIRKIGIIGAAHLPQRIGHKFRIRSIRALRSTFPAAGSHILVYRFTFLFCRWFLRRPITYAASGQTYYTSQDHRQFPFTLHSF